jgi:uncharacterized protein (TIGR03545 family)/uncharacterized protein (TIGR03546 family)
LGALNSADRSWQLSLALALSLFIALAPVFAPHNLVIYLLAFLINVHLGMFFLGAVIFKAIVYIFDPLIESLGYYVLTLPALEPLWTEIYNNPFLNLSNFNHTMIMGSLVASIILLAPSFFLFQLLTKNYRFLISKVPIARLMLKDPQPNKPALIRWWGLGVFAIIFAIIGAIYYLLSDTLIKMKLEEALSKPIGYQVTIDRLRTSLSPLGMTIEGIKIPDTEDPMKNKVEIGHLAFNINLGYLLHKKFIVEEIAASKILLETDRKTKAKKLPEQAKKEAQKASAKEAQKEPSFLDELKEDKGNIFTNIANEIPDTKSIIKSEKFKTLDESKAMLVRLQEIKDKWQEISKTKFKKAEFEALQQKYKDLEARAKELKNVQDVSAFAKEAKSFRDEVKTKRDEYKAIMKDFEADRKESKEILSRFDDLPKEDFEALKKKYSFDLSGGFNLAETLIGGEIVSKAREALGWYRMAEPYIAQANEVKTQMKGEPLPKPERGESRIVPFTERNPQPKWWVKNANFDITTRNGSGLALKVLDASGDQRITRKAMVSSIASTRAKGYEKLALAWTHDRRNVEIDKVDFAWLGVERSGFEKSRFTLAPMKMDWNINGAIDKGVFESKGKLAVKDVNISLENPRNEIEKLAQRALSGVTNFNVDMRFWGNPLFPKMAVSSDLDNILLARFKEALSARIKEFEAQLKAQIEEMARKELAKLGANEKEIAAIEKVLRGEADLLGTLEQQIGERFSEEALKKELEKRLQDSVKDSAKDKLKNLLKKK